MLDNKIAIEDLHPACIECLAARKARFPDAYNELKCDGIKKDVLKEFSSDNLSEQDSNTYRYILDPWFWGKEEFNLNHRNAQEVMTRCTAKQKVFRIGRRFGKSSTLLLSALHKMFTTPNKKVLVFTPYESQIELYFKTIRQWMDKSSALRQSVTRIVSDPNFTVELGNGSFLKGFTTGTKSGNNAGSSRGQEGDIIIIDEADLLAQADLLSILPMLQTTNELTLEKKELWVASTPIGFESFFSDWCKDPMFKEFHFHSWDNPAWTEEDEKLAHKLFPNPIDYDREYGANFVTAKEGVYQDNFIDQAIELSRSFYKSGAWDYTKQKPKRGCIYMLGVDWNAAENGTQIVIVEFDPELVLPGDQENGILARFRISYRESVNAKEYTQTKSVNKIIDLNWTWHPEGLYVDEGYGSVQIENLKTYGIDNPKSKILQRLKPINFSSMTEIIDPQTKQFVKKHTKPFLVYNSAGYLEKGLVLLNKFDTEFEKQLRDYRVEKTSREGRPIFSEGNDHILDAFNLAMLGFTMMTDLGRRVYSSQVGNGGKLGEKKLEQVIDDDGTIRIIDASRAKGPISPRRIAMNDREALKFKRDWERNLKRPGKYTRPVKRDI